MTAVTYPLPTPLAAQHTSQREVKVGTALISEDMIAQEMQYHPATHQEDAWQAATQSLVIRELLNQRAAQLNIQGASEEERTALLLEQELQTPQPTETQCLQYFKSNRASFCTPTLLVVSHILLLATPDDITQRDQQRALAQTLLEQLQLHPEQFATLAQHYSACPSASQGGSLGQITKGQTVAEFENQIRSLPQGLCHFPIESRFGIHIVRIDERVEGLPLEYSQVAPRIQQYLYEQASRTTLIQYLQRLSEDCKAEGIRPIGQLN